MDRLIALVALRWRTELRSLLRARERTLGLLLLIPSLLLFSGLASLLAHVGLRVLEARGPELLLPLASAVVSALGLLWVLSPLLAGVALSESHDMSRLLHFPIPQRTLVASSLLSNLAQPMALAQLPLLFAVSFALTREPVRLPFVFAGLALSFLFILAAAQVVGLVLHGLSRRRRWHDVALFLGLGLGFSVSLAPFLLMAFGGRALWALASVVARSDPFAFSPFAWGLRAAVHAGRGQAAGFLIEAALGVLAIGVVLAASARLIDLVYRGDLDLGGPAVSARIPRARMWFQGTVGSVIEKDLRSAWRDPGLKATLFLGLMGPLLFLILLWQARAAGGSGSLLLTLAAFIGVSSFGANAFGFERRGIGLLLSFPTERWRLLVAKNLAAAIFRLPGLLTLLLAGVFLAPLAYLPAALTVAAVTWLLATGVDNFVSILFPVTAPEPGRNPYGGAAAGGRGLGTAALTAVLLLGVLALSSPFVFLVWLPLLLGQPGLWLASLPLALAGALAVYAMLVGGAERVLGRREPELIERILGEA